LEKEQQARIVDSLDILRASAWLLPEPDDTVLEDHSKLLDTPEGRWFWSHTRPEPQPTGCLEWTAGKTEGGYGALRHEGKFAYAHQIAAKLTYGPSSGRYVLHSCDNPGCVRPKHLSYGTQAENMAASGRRITVARQAKAEEFEKFPLDDATWPAIALAIRNGCTPKQLGEQFGVSPVTIRKKLKALYAASATSLPETPPADAAV
jgi:hypothetical protein